MLRHKTLCSDEVHTDKNRGGWGEWSVFVKRLRNLQKTIMFVGSFALDTVLLTEDSILE